MTQPINAFLIVRYEADGSRRVVGSTYSQREADISCIELAKAFYNRNSNREYRTERNPKEAANG